MPVGAIIGSAVIGAGSAAYSSSQANKANNKALEANNAATAQQLAAQKEARDSNVALNKPYIDGGTAAYTQLLKRYGITPAGSSTGAQPAAQARSYQPNGAGGQSYAVPTSLKTGNAGVSPLEAGAATQPSSQPAGGAQSGGAIDYAGYAAAQPDLESWYQQHPPESVGDLTGDGQIDNSDSAAAHYAEYGQNESWRTVPTVAAQEAPQPTGPQTPTDLMTAQRPDAIQTPTYGDAPSMGFSAEDFTQSPGYAWARDEALRGANASYAGRGLLKSDSAVKGIMGRAQGLASQEYNNWFNQQMQRQQADRGQFNTDRGVGLTQNNLDQTRQDNIFNTDRSYQTGRYDTATGDLFSLSEQGLQAAGNVAGVNSAYANNTGNIYSSQANAAADAANNRASTNAQLAGTVAGIGQNIFNQYGGGANLNSDLRASAAYNPNLF